MFMGLKPGLMGHINHIMGFKTRHNVVKVPNELLSSVELRLKKETYMVVLWWMR